MSKKIVNPFGKGTAMFKILATLIRTKKPLLPEEIAKRSKVRLKTTKNMLSAMANKFHSVPMIRVGTCLTRTADGFMVEQCEPNPNAKRPARGKSGQREA